MTLKKLLLVPASMLGLLTAGTTLSSASSFAPQTLPSFASGQNGAVVLVRQGSDDGAGHDAGDDHGGDRGGSGRGGDDGAGHDAGDDHGGDRGTRDQGTDDGADHENHDRTLKSRDGKARGGADDGPGHTWMEQPANQAVAKNGADDPAGDDRGGKTRGGKGRGGADDRRNHA